MKLKLLLLMILLFASSAFADSKTISLTLLEGIDSSLDIISHSPDDDSYYTEGEDINIVYIIDHVNGTNVNCTLPFNEDQIEITNFPTTFYGELIQNLDEGHYDYQLSCDSNEESDVSELKTLHTDYTSPEITLHTQDDFFTFMDSVFLNFTVVDNLADQIYCDLFLDNNIEENLIVNSGELSSFYLDDLENGTYDWFIDCSDFANNNVISETRTFLIDISQNFSITINQDDYELGEAGYYIITAPFSAETTLVITNPLNEVNFRYIIDEDYPVIGELDFHDYPGIYLLEAIMIYDQGQSIMEIEYEVFNTFEVSIDIDESRISPGIDIHFEAIPHGGIGEITYEWDFGDGDSSTERSPIKSFEEIRSYEVRVSATDSKGNVAIKILDVTVESIYNVDINVLDLFGDPVNDASIFFSGENKITDASGVVSFDAFEGLKSVLIIKPGYLPTSDEITITDDTVLTYYLGVSNITNISNFNITIQNITKKITPILIDEPIELKGKIAFLVDRINLALEQIEDYDKKAIDAMSDLFVEENLQETKKTLIRWERDLDSLESIRDKESREERKEEISTGIENIKLTTMLGIEVKNLEEYNVDPIASNIKKLLSDYIKTSVFNDIEENIEANINIQSQLISTRTIRNIEMEMLSGEIKEITLFKEEFTGENKNGLKLINNIPEELVDDINNIVFLVEFTKVKDMMIVSYDLSNTEKTLYYVEKEISVEDSKKITSAIVDPKIKIDKKGFSLTGFAIFSTISDVEDPMLVIQIVLIIILLLVYVFYEFNILNKFRRWDVVKNINPIYHIKKLKNKDLHEINNLLEDAKKEIKEEILDKAEDTYHKLIKIYNDKLDSNLRKKSIDKISAVYNELIVHRILKKSKDINELVNANKKTTARESYNKMQEWYKELPKSWKAKVSKTCHDAFDLISG